MSNDALTLIQIEAVLDDIITLAGQVKDELPKVEKGVKKAGRRARTACSSAARSFKQIQRSLKITE